MTALGRQESSARRLQVLGGAAQGSSAMSGAATAGGKRRGLEGPRPNLPLPLDSFVGREEEVSRLSHLLVSARLVTLTGPSGIGKTRLALAVAEQVSNHYPGDVRFVELASVSDSDLVVQAVASALDVRPTKSADMVDALIAHLADRYALLVLDNCEHVVAVCASLVKRLLSGCEGLAVLATSQEPLGVAGERVWQVTPLSVPSVEADLEPEAMDSEAVTLFCDRAAETDARLALTPETVPAVAEICRRLDGIPLAIELAAARTATLSVNEIAERLADRFGLLTVGQRTAAGRHQTLRAALDWSYQLLPEPEQALLARLSVFAGGFTLQAAEEVCAGGPVPRDDLMDVLGSLVIKSLVVADTAGRRARYRLLETVREYARGRLEERGEALDRLWGHASWFTRIGERAWHPLMAGNEPWLESLHLDYENLVSAVEWSLAHGESEQALRLACALVPFWHRRGYFHEGKNRLERVLQMAGDDWPPLRARALAGIGLLATMQGDLSAATTALERSLAIARKGGFRRGTAEALRMLGFISIFVQDARAALPLLEESVALARADDDPYSLANALALYGRAHLFLGELEAARRVFEEYRQVMAETGEDSGSDAHIGLGWTALGEGNYGASATAFERALRLSRQAGDRFQTALALSFLGELAWAGSNLSTARSTLEEGLSLAQDLDAPFPMARCLLGLGRVAMAEKDLGAAERHLDQAVAVARQAQLGWALVRSLQGRAEMAIGTGDLPTAKAILDEALALARKNEDRAGVALSLQQLGRLARFEDDGEAASIQHQALTLFVEIGDAAGMANSLEALAGLAAANGRCGHAARLFGAGQSLRQEGGSARPPHLAAGYEADCSLVRSAMDPSEQEDAWSQGAALSRDEALALASRGRGGRARPVIGWASLTPMERQVVELAAERLTNREIAERLFVSPRTVQAHLLRIFPKLGVSSRRQLGEFVDAKGRPAN